MKNLTSSEHAIVEKVIDEINLFDNDFVRLILQNEECFSLILSVILKRKVKLVKHYHQYEFFNLHGRSITVDGYAITSDNVHIDLEVENGKEGAHLKRARYHASMLDSNVNPPGTAWNKLEKTMVIFVTPFDYFGEGKPIYTISRTIDDSDQKAKDDSVILYVNGDYDNLEEDFELTMLMRDFKCTDYHDMYYEPLRKWVKKYKTTQEGRKVMSTWLQEKLKDIIDAHVKDEAKEAKEEIREEFQEKLEERLKEKDKEIEVREVKLKERHKEELKEKDKEIEVREMKAKEQSRIEMILEMLKQKLGQLSSQTILKVEQCNDIQITILVNHIFDIQTEEQIINLLSLKGER